MILWTPSYTRMRPANYPLGTLLSPTSLHTPAMMRAVMMQGTIMGGAKGQAPPPRNIRHAPLAASRPLAPSPFHGAVLRPRSAFLRRDPSRQIVRTRASAAGGADPYKVLGISPDADSREVTIAYRQKMQLAKGDEDKEAVVEAAHSSIMMSSLSARLSGTVEAAKDVRYADRRVLLPWKPRWCKAEDKDVFINAGLLAAFLAYSSIQRSITPAVFASVLCLVRLNSKVNDMFPSPGGGDEKKAADNKKFVRNISLTLGSLAAGIVTVFSIPNLVSNLLYVPLPHFLVSEGLRNAVASGVACTYMFAMATFFR